MTFSCAICVTSSWSKGEADADADSGSGWSNSMFEVDLETVQTDQTVHTSP